jgi:hypothetical protein
MPPTNLPYTSPLAATTSFPPYGLVRSASHSLSHTAPAFIPGVSSSTSSKREHTMTEMGRPTISEAEAKKMASEVGSLRNQMAMWQLMDPATRHAQYQSNQAQASAILLDPKESRGKFKSQEPKNADVDQEDGDQRKNLDLLQSKATSHPKTQDAPSPRASPIMAPRTHTATPPMPPISQLTSPPTFPLLTQSLEKQTEDVTKAPPSPSFQPSSSFPQLYTTFQQTPTSSPAPPAPAARTPTTSSTPTSRTTPSTSARQWRRGGRVWGKRGTGRREKRDSPSSRTKTVTKGVRN